MNKKLMPLSLALLSLSGCATYEGYSKVQTKNITMYTALGPGRYGDVLNSLENTYSALSSSFFRNTEISQVEVLLLDDVEFIEVFGNWRKGAVVAKVPGGTAIGAKGLAVLRPYAYVPADDYLDGSDNRSQETFASGQPQGNVAGQAAAEMLTHIFIQRAMPNAPLWFHEGFSRYVSTVQLRVAPGTVYGCFGYINYPNAILPLNDMFNMTFEKYVEPSVRDWFPATGLALIDFVLHGQNQRHRQRMGSLVLGVANGADPAELVPGVFDGISIAQLDEAVKVHRQEVEQLQRTPNVRGQCPYGIEIPADKQPAKQQAKATPVEGAQIEAVMRGLNALPYREEFPPYYPMDVVEKVKVSAAGQ